MTWITSVRSLGAFALSSTLATQLYAWLQAYHPALGQPWLLVSGWPVYAPWKLAQWAWHWALVQPQPFTWPALLVVGLTVALPALGAYVDTATAQTASPVQWATRRSLLHADLFAEEGVVFGTWHGRRVCYDGTLHSLMVAPTGGGKTQTTGIPTALSWGPPRPDGQGGSLIVHDPKNELYPHTAGFRSQFSRVYHLNPTDPQSDCYDPLRGIRIGKSYEIRDALLLAEMLGNPDGERPTSDAGQHFGELRTDFLIAVTLHGLYTRQATTLVGLDQFFMSEAALADTIRDMYQTHHTRNGPHRAVRRGLTMVQRLSDRELSGVQSTASRALRMTLDPLVARMTSRSSFTLQDLRERTKPISVYLTVPYSDQERLRPLSRLLIRQWLDYVTQRLTGWNHRLLFLLDEVQALKHMPTLRSAMTFVRGYGVNLCLITPSLLELGDDAEPYVENAHIRVVYAPNSRRVANKFAEMTGEVQVEKARESVADDTQRLFGKRHMTTTSTAQEPLYSGTQVAFMPPDTGLLLIGNGGAPALVKKALAYQSRRLRRLMRLPVRKGAA